MKEQFLDYEHSKMLKEIGFDEECLAMYDDGRYTLYDPLESGLNKNSLFDTRVVCAPLYQQVEQWFLEKFRCHIAMSEDGRRFSGSETFDSPVIARREAIKAAVKQMYQELKK